jgi:hypothetical protein
MNYPALILSTLALIFTVSSFWWMNWRVGRLWVGIPRSYGFHNQDRLLILEFPFAFYNDGPIPILIQNLRLILLGEEERRPLKFVVTLKKIASDENRTWATQIPVNGREAVVLVCQFQRTPSESLEAGTQQVMLQGKLGPREEAPWKDLCQFSLHLSSSAIEQRAHLIAYDNETDEDLLPGRD